MKKLLLSFLAFAFLAQAFAQNAGRFPIQVLVLKNGLTVYLNEDPHATKVFGAIVVNAGSKNDPPSATGIAHYLEHMSFKGTQKIGTSDWAKEKPYMDNIVALYDELGRTTDQVKIDSIQKEINKNTVAAARYNMPTEFDKLVSDIGGTQLNAFTMEDMTFYHNEFPASQIDKWLKLYSERLLNPVFRSFQPELEVVYEEKNRSMDEFTTELLEELNKNIFKGHPYGTQTTLGTVEDLKKPSLSKMYAFYKKYYVASNMALVLVGNFNSREVIPAIKKEFGRLPKGKRAVDHFKKPAGFDTRTVETKRFTPVKMGMMAFKTVPLNSKDIYTVDLMASMLSNQGQTGLLDQLATDNKIMFATAMPMSYEDDGALVILFVPKLLGQSFDKAEELIKAQLYRLKNGDFSLQMLENAKRKTIQDHEQTMEDIEERGIEIGYMFVLGQTPQQFNAYVDNISKITKADVMEAAGKYFGKGYFVLQSKMGFPEKTKLKKPGFEPVKPDQDKLSDYARQFMALKGKEAAPRFLDFDRDVQKVKVGKASTLYANKNPYDNLFSLTISYRAGTRTYNDLPYLSELLGLSGTGSLPVDSLKARFSDLGINYRFEADENNWSIHLDGGPGHLKEALALLRQLVGNPKIDKKRLSQMVDAVKSDRKMQLDDPSDMGDILLKYALFRSGSEYLKQPSLKDLKKYTAEKALNTLAQVRGYSADIYFTGNIGADSVAKYLAADYGLRNKVKAERFVIQEPVENRQNTVFFVNDKKAVQSQVYFVVAGNLYKQGQYPYIKAFNAYFDGGFSGLVLQEIREYRSLAYSAYGEYKIPYKENVRAGLTGYVGCQADKTLTAIGVMDSLIRFMPKKPDRTNMIKQSLYLGLQTAYPVFREVPEKIGFYEKAGLREDPDREAARVYPRLTFGDIYRFYTENIAGKPVVIALYGDKNKIDIEKLKQYGKVIELSKKDIFRY